MRGSRSLTAALEAFRDARGYNSTCKVEVVERGNKLKEMADIEKALHELH